MFPYRDSRGILTIGVGRNLVKKGISRTEALYLLSNDITECFTELSKMDFFISQNEVRQCVLIDMCFNLGLEGLMEFRKMICALKEQNYNAAAEEIRNSKAALETGSRYPKLAYYMERGAW